MSEFASGALSEGAGTRDGGRRSRDRHADGPRGRWRSGSPAARLPRSPRPPSPGSTPSPASCSRRRSPPRSTRGARRGITPRCASRFELAEGDRRPLVARSSSVLEDTAGSSMAGQFDSIIGIDTFEAFVDAAQSVLDSRERAGVPGSPIAVLVQPLIEPRYGGVLFGVDPVTGRTDRRTVSAVEGGPEPLVSGEVDGSRYVLDTKGRVDRLHPRRRPGAAGRPSSASLVALSMDVERVFGGPQDVEWAVGVDGHLWLLQSRPVTTEIRGVPVGPVYGPGPVAETFPEPLAELEHDLWVPPLRDAVREAVLLAGIVTPKEVGGQRGHRVVGGHVAIDLRLAGEIRAQALAPPEAEPGAGRAPPARGLAGRSAPSRDAHLRPAAPRPGRR